MWHLGSDQLNFKNSVPRVNTLMIKTEDQFVDVDGQAAELSRLKSPSTNFHF